MAKIEITLLPWVLDHQARDGEVPTAVVMTDVGIDGLILHSHQCRLVADGALSIEIKDPSDGFRAQYLPSEYLEGTTDELLILPVTELVIR